MANSTQTQRAALSSDLIALRETLLGLLPQLEAQPSWYASIFFERKRSKTFSANLKQTNIADQASAGVVFRIYDGYTLFERATDDLSAQNLNRTVAEFVQRVKNSPHPEGATLRAYPAPSWKDRLSSGELDPEIKNQIPADVTARTPVHFGIRFMEDPRKLDAGIALEKLKALLDRCQKLAPESGLKESDLTYVAARQTTADEESIFIDRGSVLSQTLLRQALTVITMSESDRTHLRVGGLGGLEAIEVEENELRTLLKDLAALKSAHKLTPGKYRVLFGPVLSGVLAHEAFGHSQEADTCARGRSKAWELYASGEKVGNEHATILNNPAIFETGGKPFAAWGSYFFDEEGWLAQSQVLLDHGRLKAPMTNLTSALRLGVARTANGKRESWANGVYTRQTNTYFSPGKKTLAGLMSELGDGFLALHPAGGMEDPKGMGIQVGISYLQEVKGGALTGRVFKGPAGGDIQLTGYTPDVLNSIVDKSKIEFDSPEPDKALHPWNDAGGCGKYHKEFVFAGCGGPYMLLDQVILG
ncbi:MAG: TldD/PmbA family protein [Oligoflexia bacterium]|nr:TldD/PmbA family protein [Oligoflexia bacterium]